MKKTEYSIKLFINNRRKLSHFLTKEEALNFIATAQHFIKYLEEAYINE